MKSKKYPNLYSVTYTPNWVFRKYSKEKRADFTKSTGVPATEKEAARAYKIGTQAYADWLGVFTESGRQMLVKDYARAVLAAKQSKKPKTYQSARDQIENHVIPAFGHLRPEQVTSLRWEQYDSLERRRVKVKLDGTKVQPRTKLFNTRKLLNEILRRAMDDGQIRKLPKLVLNDLPPAPPVYIPKVAILEILSQMRGRARRAKLLAFIMWKQGARPREVLQYRWDMITWESREIAIPGAITKTNRSRTIPINSKVFRILSFLYPHSDSDFIFPNPKDPTRAQTEYKTAWGGACRKSGRKFEIYSLRDTMITDCLRRGWNSSFVAKYVDNSAAIIDRRYAVAAQDVLRGIAG